jgi:hypothetical protein
MHPIAQARGLVERSNSRRNSFPLERVAIPLALSYLTWFLDTLNHFSAKYI